MHDVAQKESQTTPTTEHDSTNESKKKKTRTRKRASVRVSVEQKERIEWCDNSIHKCNARRIYRAISCRLSSFLSVSTRIVHVLCVIARSSIKSPAEQTYSVFKPNTTNLSYYHLHHMNVKKKNKNRIWWSHWT